MGRKVGIKFSNREQLCLWEFYQVTWHNNECGEDCPGYVTEDVMQFRGEDNTTEKYPILIFAEPDEDDPDEWYERRFEWYEYDLEFALVIQ